MLYGRVIRPPVPGARPMSADAESISQIVGAKVVRKSDFIGVVAESEWDAIQAAAALKVVWSDAPDPLVPHTSIHDHIRKTIAAKRQIETAVGDVEAVFANKENLLEAEYAWPFQSHASLAPACAVAEFSPEAVTVWHSSQKPHATSQGIAKMLGMPTEAVRSIYVAGPGSYGRNDAGDAAADAVVMAQLTGRPVRVEGARSDGHGWDPKATASVHKVRAVLDDDGRLEAYQFMSKAFSRMEVDTAESKPNDMLAGMLLGFDNPPVHKFTVPTDSLPDPEP